MKTDTKVAAHTPGPWYTSPQQGYVRYEGVHGPNICGMDAFGGPAEEAFANARLIAAAPEMLEALEAIVAEADQSNGGKGARLPIVIYMKELAEAAITKARGGGGGNANV